MSSSVVVRAVVLSGFVVTMAAGSALDAQGIGGRIRNSPVGRTVDRASGRDTATKERSGDVAQAPTPARQEQGQPTVVEMTDDVLDRFQMAMAREIEVRAAYGAVEEQRQQKQNERGQCLMNLMMSADYQASMERMQTAADKQDAKAVQAISEQLARTMEEKCGPDPSSGEYASTSDFEKQSSEAGQFTDRQYGVLKERIVPFCNANVAADPNGITLPGAGKGWVYSGAEVQALKPRCAAIMSSLRTLM